MTQAEEIYKKARDAEERAEKAYGETEREIYGDYMKVKNEAFDIYKAKSSEAFKRLWRAQENRRRARVKVEDEKHADRTNTEK